MRKLAATSFALASVFTGVLAAQAADLPSRSPAPSIIEPVPVTNWTGFYGGVSIGFATDRYTFPYAFGSAQTGVNPGRGTIVSSGLIGGGQVGVLYQTPWNIVVGAEINIEGSTTNGSLPVGFPGVIGTIKTEVPYFGAFRAKLGYAFESVPYVGNLLVYLAMGGAIAKFHDQATVWAGPNPVLYDRSTSRFEVSTHIGTVGIGVAHKFTPNLSVFGEYRYTALGPQMGGGRSIQIVTPTAAGAFATRAMYHLGKVGVNYHFTLF